jgi:hypothetical protein
MCLGYSASGATDVVRDQRGLDEEGFGALGNPGFVVWLREEDLREGLPPAT